VTRQTALLLHGLALVWAVPVLVFLAGKVALASGSGEGSAGATARAAPNPPCPGQRDASAPVALQELAMQCLVDRARRERGLPDFARVPGLDRAADRKSGDVLRCDEFDHEACGREFAYWIERFGHFGDGCSGVAENIAWGTGSRAAPAGIFRAWMRSPGHRENILGPYALTGVGLRIGTLEGRPGAHVWTQEFAAEGC